MSNLLNPKSFLPADHPLHSVDVQGNPRRQINITKYLPKPNAYTEALNGFYKERAFDELRALENKGEWRRKIFNKSENVPLDLEVGTGNGMHFAWYVAKNPHRLLVGLELKYKPLIQSIRRALAGGHENAAICRFHAFNVDLLFRNEELNNVFIHFPDPWTAPLKPKNRFVSRDNLKLLHGLQKNGSFIDFKTDSQEYFEWVLEQFPEELYFLSRKTNNLHRSEWNEENFKTQFEKLFTSKGMPIYYMRLEKRG